MMPSVTSHQKCLLVQLVRCILWPQLKGISSITGGEDGRIVAWTEPATAEPSPRQKKQKLNERKGSLLPRVAKKTKRQKIEK